MSDVGWHYLINLQAAMESVSLGLYLVGTFVHIWRRDSFWKQVAKWSALSVAIWQLLQMIPHLMLRDHKNVMFDCAVGLWWLVIWWFNGGKDDWKKLKKRVREAVARVGSRLVVAPVPQEI